MTLRKSFLGGAQEAFGLRSVTGAYRGSVCRSGFTLVEMIIVVVIMGIMLGLLVAPLDKMRDGMRIDGAAQQVVGDIRRLQVEAIKRNKSLSLLRTGATTYTVDSVGNRALEDGVTFTDASASELRMASFGPPVGGGATFVLTYGTRQKTIAVNAAGMLTLQ